VVPPCRPPCRCQGTVAAAQQALAAVDRSMVAGIAVSGQQHGMVVLDEQVRVTAVDAVVLLLLLPVVVVI
jgi:sugar (pentulose or hexulose) kinase